MNKAYKFRLYPNQAQKAFIDLNIDCARWIYNRMLRDKIDYYEEHKEMLNTQPSQYKEENSDLALADSQALSYAGMHLRAAYNAFFTRPQMGFPKFKPYSQYGSYTSSRVKIENGKLILPKMRKSPVKIRMHREIPNNCVIKSATISHTPSDKYFASILVEYKEEAKPIQHPKTVLGLAFSAQHLYEASDGTIGEYPHFYQQSLDKLQIEQAKYSKMTKGTRAKEKQRLKIANLHEKISNQRKDFLHKLSTDIADQFDCVVVEDVKISELSQIVNKEQVVTDNGWNMFLTLLQYKLADRGKMFMKIKVKDTKGILNAADRSQFVAEEGLKQISA